MRRISVDLSQSTCSVAEEPRRLTDFTTKQPKVNASGEPLTSVKMLMQTPSEMSIVAVTVPASGVPDNLKITDPVTLTNVVASPSVDRGGKVVVYFDAERVERVAKAKAA